MGLAVGEARSNPDEVESYFFFFLVLALAFFFAFFLAAHFILLFSLPHHNAFCIVMMFHV